MSDNNTIAGGSVGNYRFADFELRSQEDGGPPVLEARFARWDSPNFVHTWQEGEFFETLERGATNETFESDGESIRALFDHGQDTSIGMKTLGVYRGYEDTDKAPMARFELFEHTSHVADIMPGLRSQPPTYGLSYRFAVTDPSHETWDYHPERSKVNPQGLPERTIHKAEVLEVSVTPFPMDRTTNVGGALSVRSLETHLGITGNRDDRNPEAAPGAVGPGTPDTSNRDEILAGLADRRRRLLLKLRS